jgi:MFS family permease
VETLEHSIGRGNVILLSMGQALGTAGATMVIFAGGLVGTTLAPTASLATLPVAAVVVGSALNTVPAAMLMRTIGRRAGFMAGALAGAGAALLAAWAVARGLFAVFCGATLLIGASLSFVNQYRFAAAESVAREHAARAISFVMLGGVVAAFLGPEIGNRARTLLDTEFAGSFVALALVYGVLTVLLLALRDVPPPAGQGSGGAARGYRQLLSDPAIVSAIAVGAAAFGIMSFVMTATPISMHVHDGHDAATTARVIQGHVIAMFLPSLFSGMLVARFGAHRIIFLGMASLLLSALLGILSRASASYTLALILLGIGWNFLFLGGTVLLSQSYRVSERFRAQALNDALVFGTQAVAALSAGAAVARLGWRSMNLLVIAVLVVGAVLFRIAATSPRRPPAALVQE